MNNKLCDSDSDPAEYFLNKKLSEQQAHANFMAQPPKVLREQQDFMNEIAKVNEPIKVSVNNDIAKVFDEPQSKPIQHPNVTYRTASTCSSDVPIINRAQGDDDDDNNKNTTKMIELMTASSNGSILATLELNTIIRTTKAKSGEVMELDTPYTTCVNAYTPHIASQDITY
jgi:hypothetical protein